MALTYPQIPPRAASRQMYRDTRTPRLTLPQQRWEHEQLQGTTHEQAQPLPPTPARLHELHSEPLDLPPSWHVSHSRPQQPSSKPEGLQLPSSWHVSQARVQHPSSACKPTGSTSSSYPLQPSALPTHDPSLHHLHTTLLSPQTPTLGKSPDCTLPVLLALLHAKLACLPLEQINLSTRFLSNMSLQHRVSESQRKSASVLDGYVAILKRQRMDLEEMIRVGEDLYAREMENLNVEQDREVWWFVARALLSRSGVEI